VLVNRISNVRGASGAKVLAIVDSGPPVRREVE